jgi:hypothetical protein
MKQIGAEIGVNESRVSQLHARAIKRLRVVLADMAPADAMTALKSAVLAFHHKPVMAKAQLQAKAPAVIVNIKPGRANRFAGRVLQRNSRVAVAAAR